MAKPARTALRFRGLATRKVLGFEVTVAKRGTIGRLIGLIGLNRKRCPAALLLDNTSRTHTFGNRFNVDLLFISPDWKPLIVVRHVESGRRITVKEAGHVLVLPSDWDIDIWNPNPTGDTK